MQNRRTLRQLVVALVLLVSFLSQGTWALAGTTGGLGGQVSNEKGVPVAGAAVKIVSASQTAVATTDAGGRYVFLNLAPDTYTLTATKDGYNPTSAGGVVVFADQNLTENVTLQPTGLKNIANVSARSSGNLVRAGTTVDVYSVNSATATQMATSGGGNNLDSAYSAIGSTPGVTSLPGNFGFGQLFFIHGSSYSQIGYEFDGVPVNRSFDNYNANSLSNLGTSSTEIYTGGGPAGATSPTLGGYVNQVIKTGTFPGFGNLSGGIGSPGFYHQAQIEAGGATPDRLFSYYVGIRGSDMIPNQLDAQNGNDLNPNGDNAFGQQGIPWNTLMVPFADFGLVPANGDGQARGPWATCNGRGQAPAGAAVISPALTQYYAVNTTVATCNNYDPLYGTLSLALRGNDLSDRENVVNFHIGIPHHNDSGRDDVQILFDNFFYQTQGWDNFSTNGGLPMQENMLEPALAGPGAGYYGNFAGLFGIGLTPYQNPQYPGLCAYFNFTSYIGFGNPPCAGSGQTPAAYWDAYQVHAQFGQTATGQPNILSKYYFPSTSTDRPFQSGFSPFQVSDTDNNGSIVKLQYTKNFGSSAYVRVFGYTFYSDWLQTDPNFGFSPFLVGGATAGDYELNTHTRGLYLQAADQINSQNLVSFTTSYTTASVTRDNNQQYTFQPAFTPIATLMGPGGQCYAAYDNAQAGGKLYDPGYGAGLKAGAPVSCLSALTGGVISQVQAGSLPAVPGGSPAGTSWQLTQNLAPDANINTVSPKLFDAAIQDEFRPSDRWDVNLGVRFESYGYGLGNFASPSQSFWFNQVNQTVCVDPSGLNQVPGSDFTGGSSRYGGVPSGYPTYYTTAPGQPCLADPLTGHTLYHPGAGGIPQITLGGNGTITNTTWSPRIGFTYSMSPSSVLRFSYGRYTQPTPTAYEQVLTYPDGYVMANNLYNSQYYNNGLASIVHNNPIQFSNNFDASYEQHLTNTDISFKISPFYRYTSNQSVQVSLPGGLAGAFNAGTGKNQGFELAVDKGDPTRNGFSGELSYTYTYSQLKYALINGSNIIANMLTALDPFLQLEAVNGGQACYGVPTATKGGKPLTQGQIAHRCAVDAASASPKFISNPYYGFNYTKEGLASQYPLDAFYPTYANSFPSGLQGGDVSTIIPPNVFSSWISWKHNRLQATLTGNLWEGQKYGAPGDVAGLDPRSCTANAGQTGFIAGSQLADYQSCGSALAIPNPMTAKFDNVAQYRDPWDLNLGAQIAYDLTPRVKATVLFANILNACFGGSAEPWTASYAPSSVICAYAPNPGYLGWSPGEVYNTAGAGFFYGNNPHNPANGTAHYPKLFEQAYEPITNQISSPFQMYFTVNVKL